MKHLISTDQITKEYLQHIYKVTDDYAHLGMHKLTSWNLAKCSLANIFFSPSFRTKLSFEMAAYKLGGNVIASLTEQPMETLEDTIKTVSTYADYIVLRHPDVNSAQRASEVSSCSVINAGNGNDEHPTQAIVDLYTILKAKGTLNGIKVLVAGNLAHSKEAHSFIKLMNMFDTEVYVFSPAALKLPGKWNVIECGSHPSSSHPHPEAILKKMDVVYMVKDKYNLLNPIEFKITPQNIENMQTDAIILHPFPRGGEIDPTIDNNPRVMYFKQMEYGVKVRMSILQNLFMS